MTLSIGWLELSPMSGPGGQTGEGLRSVYTPVVNILSCNEAKNISCRNKNYSRKLKTIQKRLQGERRVRISLDFSSMFI